MRSLAELNRLLAMMDVTVQQLAWHRIDGEIRQPPPPPGCVTIAYVTAGGIGVALPGRTPRSCPAHTMVLVPGALHVSASVDEEAESPGMVCGQVEVRISGSSLFDRVTVPIFADLSRSPLVRPCMDELIRLWAIDPEALGAGALANSLMKTCILTLLQDFFGRPGIDLKIISALADPRLAAVIAAVLERPQDAHSLTRMSARAGLSRSTFSRLFSKAMGQTPIDFVTKTRLYYAAELLRTGVAPVKAVAVNVGFSSRSHFSRAFSEAYGTDPTAYRQAHAVDAPTPVPQDLRRIGTSPDPVT